MTTRRVAFLDLGEQHASLHDALGAAFERVMASHQFVLGKEVERLEAELAIYTELRQSRHAVGCGSGTDALMLALRAHDVAPGDEVLVPAFSFFATAGAPALLGARPIFADIDPATFHLDVEDAVKRAGGAKRLRAIIPVHLYGAPLAPAIAEQLAAACGVPILEDAAQALGARAASGHAVGGAGTSAAVTCFSFYPTKNLGAAGEAGLVTCHDDQLAERLRRLRNHGAERDGRHLEVGWNARLDALQAALLRVKLPYLERWNTARRENARDYSARLRAAGAMEAGLPPEAGSLPITLPAPDVAPAQGIAHQFVVRVPGTQRDPLRAHLAAHGVDTAVYYPLGLHLQPCFNDLGYRPGDLPETERATREVLSLPVHPSLEAADREHVVDCIVRFFGGRRS